MFCESLGIQPMLQVINFVGISSEGKWQHNKIAGVKIERSNSRGKHEKFQIIRFKPYVLVSLISYMPLPPILLSLYLSTLYTNYLFRNLPACNVISYKTCFANLFMLYLQKRTQHLVLS